MNTAHSYQVALLTGQSDFSRWALSPIQTEFLQALGLPAESIIYLNFPYRPNSPAHRSTPLITASLNNGIAYLVSRRLHFSLSHLRTVQDIVTRRERTIFITGSCGLELFNNLRIPTASLLRIGLIALGPVARHRPSCGHVLVGSRRDLISRRFFRMPDQMVDSSHLGYLSNSTVRTLCRNFVSDFVGREPIGEPPV